MDTSRMPVRNGRTPWTVHLARTIQIGDRALCGITLGRRWMTMPGNKLVDGTAMCLIYDGADRR